MSAVIYSELDTLTRTRELDEWVVELAYSARVPALVGRARNRSALGRERALGPSSVPAARVRARTFGMNAILSGQSQPGPLFERDGALALGMSTHQGSVPRVRPDGNFGVSGVLPAELVQRVVRQNFGASAAATKTACAEIPRSAAASRLAS